MDKGKELMNQESASMASIRLDERALTEALALQAGTPEWQGLPLRLYIEGKGCDGFYYGVAFDAARPDDLHFPQPSPQRPLAVVVDPDSIEFVAGSLITWVDDERGRGFLVENPQHRKFRGKFYRRQAWQDRQPGRSEAKPATPDEA